MGSSIEILVLCPFCLSRIQKDTVVCKICREDTTHYAKIEITQEQYNKESKRDCPECTRSISVFSKVCRYCQAVLQW